MCLNCVYFETVSILSIGIEIFSGKKYVGNDLFHCKNKIFRDSVTTFMQFFDKYACLHYFFEVMCYVPKFEGPEIKGFCSSREGIVAKRWYIFNKLSQIMRTMVLDPTFHADWQQQSGWNATRMRPSGRNVPGGGAAADTLWWHLSRWIGGSRTNGQPRGRVRAEKSSLAIVVQRPAWPILRSWTPPSCQILTSRPMCRALDSIAGRVAFRDRVHLVWPRASNVAVISY